MKSIGVIVLLAATAGACTHTSTKQVENAVLRRAVTAETNSFFRYQLTGGRWVPSSNIFVNSDFDIAFAATGFTNAAIAARRRSEAADKVAKLLEGIGTAWFEGRPAPSEFVRSKEQKIRYYAIVFGKENAVAQAVLELEENSPKPTRLIYVSRGLSIQGEQSWSANSGQRLASFLADAADKLRRIEPTTLGEALKETAHCKVSIFQNPQGQVTGIYQDRVILRFSEFPDTLLLCPHEMVETSSSVSRS